jgi:hypothetical protein
MLLGGLLPLPVLAQGFTESFETGLGTGNHATVTPLTFTTGTWFAHNRSTPIGTTGVFANGGSFSGPTGGGANYATMSFDNGVSGSAPNMNTLNTFLMSPVQTFNNNDTIRFQTRTATNPFFPDRLRVRLSTNGTSTNTADFTTILLTINDGLTTAGYPDTWTEFTATVTGLSGPTAGRFAFHYDVLDTFTNGDVVGIDLVTYTPVPEPLSILSIATVGALGWHYRRRRPA